MGNEAESLRRRYEEIMPALELVCGDLLSWLTQLTEDLGVLYPRLEGRVKTGHSLLLKALRKEIRGDPWADPLVDATDKVGVRADVVYTTDVDSLREAIWSADDIFEQPIEIDDKLHSTLGVDRLGYQGVHFDVIPKDLPDGLPAAMARCEIQVRTNAQAAWAMATHDLTYKAPVDPGAKLLRRVNRLTALLECFDEDVHRTRKEMMGREGYPVAIVLSALEAARMRFPVAEYDRELSRDIVVALLDDADADDAHVLAREIEDFAERESEKLQALFTQVEHGHPLVGQPETLLIFMQLELQPLALQRTWVDHELPYRVLDELASDWGVNLPAPH